MHQGTAARASHAQCGPGSKGPLLWNSLLSASIRNAGTAQLEKVAFNLHPLSNHPHCALKDKINQLGSPVVAC